jgi:hypothetical protein
LNHEDPRNDETIIVRDAIISNPDTLLQLNQTTCRTRESCGITGLNTLRKSYQQLLKHEKRQRSKSYVEETAQSKDIKKFYDLMKRLNPSFTWNVNTGSMREDTTANEIVEIEQEPSYAGLHELMESQKKELESVVRGPDRNYFSIIEWNIVMQSLKNRRFPDRHSMSFENWKQLEPELVPFISNCSAKQSPQEMSIRNGSGSMSSLCPRNLENSR